MDPHSEIADDPSQDVKALLDRWSQEDRSFQEHETFIAVWCALVQQGFSDIRLRREPHDLPHNLWRFSMRRGKRHAIFMAVESAVRRAFGSLCHALAKDCVAAMICGPRARGVFILPVSPR